ncbi:MAG: hypothetical protein LBG29_00895 [Synergistaceae bacterium]|nr:hypothetical protein [Synergistaceae bacterium]
MEIHFCHFPPGTSKRNKVEHRLFDRFNHHFVAHPNANGAFSRDNAGIIAPCRNIIRRLHRHIRMWPRQALRDTGA